MRKKSVVDKSEIAILNKTNEHLDRKMLLHCIQKETSKKRERSLEQKIMILKLLQVNEMNYKHTSDLIGVSRKALNKWWGQYGEILKESEPEYVIAQTVENNLAQLMDDTYNETRKAIKKMGQLIEKTDNPRHIYAVKEAVSSMVEVLKLNKQEEITNKDTFFSDIMKEMFK